MNSLSSSDDLLQRKAQEREQRETPRRRAEVAEHYRVEARRECWDLLEQFVTRVRELGIEPRRWESPSSPITPRVLWIVGYPLTNGAFVTAPPLQYCIAERRKLLRPRHDVRTADELTLFTSPLVDHAEAARLLVLQTADSDAWPYIDRVEHAHPIVHGVRTTLEKSLIALLD